MRVLVVVNPRATAMSERQRDVLAHALGSSADLQIEPTANRGHAAALACRAMRDQVDVVVALGGDGTVNEVANGLLTDGVHDKVPALGVVPAGSTNVFARAIGLPNNPIEATGALLDGLRHGRRRPISLGRLEDRWFTFTAGVGFDAAIVAGVEKYRARGKRSTHALYARVGVREFLRSDRRHPKLHVELPDGRIAWSFPDVGVSVAPFIQSGPLEMNGRLYTVQHLYGLRPFPDDETMLALQRSLWDRVIPWVEGATPYCNPSHLGRSFPGQSAAQLSHCRKTRRFWRDRMRSS